jgi:hypothetical protein
MLISRAQARAARLREQQRDHEELEEDVHPRLHRELDQRLPCGEMRSGGRHAHSIEVPLEQRACTFFTDAFSK